MQGDAFTIVILQEKVRPGRKRAEREKREEGDSFR